VLVLVVVLAVTNAITAAVLVWYLVRPVEHPSPDAQLAARLQPATSTSSPRRVITIEILNAVELARTRGRLAGLAGSIAPGVTRRIVYDQAIKLVRQQLAGEGVAADVRLHVVRATVAAAPQADLDADGQEGLRRH
jgi:hypothetical protein